MAGVSISLASKSSTQFSFSWTVTLNTYYEGVVKYRLQDGSVKIKCNNTTLVSSSSLSGTTEKMYYTQWSPGNSQSQAITITAQQEYCNWVEIKPATSGYTSTPCTSTSTTDYGSYVGFGSTGWSTLVQNATSTIPYLSDSDRWLKIKTTTTDSGSTYTYRYQQYTYTPAEYGWSTQWKPSPNPFTASLTFYPHPKAFDFGITKSQWEISKGITSIIPNYSSYQAYAKQRAKYINQSSVVNDCPSMFDSNNRLSAAQLAAVYKYFGKTSPWSSGDIVKKQIFTDIQGFINS